jgi:hypothetical protein
MMKLQTGRITLRIIGQGLTHWKVYLGLTMFKDLVPTTNFDRRYES